MLHHYITRYMDDERKLIIVSWLQLDIFNKSYCFSKREITFDIKGITDEEYWLSRTTIK